MKHWFKFGLLFALIGIILNVLLIFSEKFLFSIVGIGTLGGFCSVCEPFLVRLFPVIAYGGVSEMIAGIFNLSRDIGFSVLIWFVLGILLGLIIGKSEENEEEEEEDGQD